MGLGLTKASFDLLAPSAIVPIQKELLLPNRNYLGAGPCSWPKETFRSNGIVEFSIIPMQGLQSPYTLGVTGSGETIRESTFQLPPLQHCCISVSVTSQMRQGTPSKIFFTVNQETSSHPSYSWKLRYLGSKLLGTSFLSTCLYMDWRRKLSERSCGTHEGDTHLPRVPTMYVPEDPVSWTSQLGSSMPPKKSPKQPTTMNAAALFFLVVNNLLHEGLGTWYPTLAILVSLVRACIAFKNRTIATIVVILFQYSQDYAKCATLPGSQLACRWGPQWQKNKNKNKKNAKKRKRRINLGLFHVSIPLHVRSKKWRFPTVRHGSFPIEKLVGTRRK